MLHVHPFLLKDGHFAISFQISVLVPHLPLSPAQQRSEGQRHQSLASGLRQWKANSTLQSHVAPSAQLGLPKASAAAVASASDALAAPSNETLVTTVGETSSEIQAVSMSCNN